MSAPHSLARQNTLLLASAFLLVELLAALVLARFLMLPMARRSADDLAGLMMLSVQTWTELPPETRPVFEHELMRNHALALRREPAGEAPPEWHPPYYYLLEDALAERLGFQPHLMREEDGAERWYWIDLPAGGDTLTIGFPATRIETQPLPALAATFVLGLIFAVSIAYWLARRITAPLARLNSAARQLGQGGQPEQLPETGPLELAALATRFNTMARQVRDLISARTLLLAGISHDLRTPLARMLLALEMLKDDPSPKLIERLERDADEMNRLIAAMLDLARGLEAEAPVDTDVASLLHDLALDTEEAGATVRVVCPSCCFPLPQRAMRRALGNLLQNAVRYAPGEPIDLVGVCTDASCRFGVLDGGPGIPEAQIEDMFQPFRRMESSRNTLTGGAGLGLAIVRELATANGWQVLLKPRTGGGLEAWIEVSRQNGTHRDASA